MGSPHFDGAVSASTPSSSTPPPVKYFEQISYNEIEEGEVRHPGVEGENCNSM
jgi:hypothetical protein